MQIDAHMTFAQDWDALSIEMLEDAPSKKPITSHYQPVETFDFDKNVNTPAPRLCGGTLAISSIESQIVRLQLNVDDRGTKCHTPRIAPVIAAGKSTRCFSRLRYFILICIHQLLIFSGYAIASSGKILIMNNIFVGTRLMLM